jgi:hypothetical protein
LKILLSGFTQRMVNSQKLRYDYITPETIVKNLLTGMRHKVDHRPVETGESLKKYDLALVGIGPSKSFTARHIAGAAWAFHHARRVVLFCDDWSIANTGGDFRASTHRWEGYVKWHNSLGEPFTGAQATQTREMLLAILADTGKIKLLAQMFPWGKHERLLAGNLPLKLAAWDPTPFTPSYASNVNIASEIRKKSWVYAALQNHDGWMKKTKFNWPVDRYGNKRLGHPYLSEKEILTKYRESWGVICPSYSRAGSGWWRVRYQMSRDAGSVLYAGQEDTETMGVSYKLTASAVEGLEAGELAKLAAGQAAWFDDNVSSKKKTREAIAEAIEA